MTVTADPSTTPLNRRQLMIALFLGLVSFAAVWALKLLPDAKAKCDPDLLTADDGLTVLLADDGEAPLTAERQQCEVKIGHRRFKFLLDPANPGPA